jgi:hypothetical protein
MKKIMIFNRPLFGDHTTSLKMLFLIYKQNIDYSDHNFNSSEIELQYNGCLFLKEMKPNKKSLKIKIIVL